MPESTHPPSRSVAASATPAGVPAARRLGERPGGDALAARPAPASSAACWSGVPDRASVSATTLTGRSGPGDTSRPISSATSTRSSRPVAADAAAAELARGPASSVHPSSAPRRQYSRSKPPPGRRRASRTLRERALGLEEAARRLDEQLLVVLQLQLHRRSSPRSRVAAPMLATAHRTAPRARSSAISSGEQPSSARSSSVCSPSPGASRCGVGAAVTHAEQHAQLTHVAQRGVRAPRPPGRARRGSGSFMNVCTLGPTGSTAATPASVSRGDDVAGVGTARTRRAAGRPACRRRPRGRPPSSRAASAARRSSGATTQTQPSPVS